MKTQHKRYHELFLFNLLLALLLLTIPAKLCFASRENPKKPFLFKERLDPSLKPLKPMIQGFIDQGQVPGVELILIRKGTIVFWEALGYTDVDFEKPLRKNTIVFIGSTTKPFSASTLMLLVDEGRLSLDDPVSDYLPAFSNLKLKNGNPAPSPTIRQLLSHTSGFEGLKEMSPDGEYASREMSLTLEESVNRISELPLMAKPGTRFSYGGISFNVAGRVVEVVSGQPFETFMKQRLLDPLGTTDITFRPTPEQGERISAISKPAPWGGLLTLMRFNPNADRTLCLVGGGLYGTALDVAKFFQMQLNDGIFGSRRILSKQAVREMQFHQTGDANLAYAPKDDVSSYGLGWIRDRVAPDGAAREVSHAGIFGSDAWIDHDRELLGVLFIPIPLNHALPFHRQIRSKVRSLIPAGD